jgi:hypothetical protein
MWRSLLAITSLDALIVVLLLWFAFPSGWGQIDGVVFVICLGIAFAVSPRHNIGLGLKWIPYQVKQIMVIPALFLGGVAWFKMNAVAGCGVFFIFMHCFATFFLCNQQEENQKKLESGE